jgi:hypothetical protein
MPWRVEEREGGEVSNRTSCEGRLYTSGYRRLMTMLDFDKAINVVLGVSYAIVTQMIACIVSLLERAQVCALVCISLSMSS